MGDLGRERVRLPNLRTFQEIIPLTVSVEYLPQMPPTRYLHVVSEAKVPYHQPTRRYGVRPTGVRDQ
jgi:hypothetical protein